MNQQQAFEKLSSIGQAHLLNYLEELTSEGEQHLLEQINQLNIPVFRRQQQLLAPKPRLSLRLLDPVKDCEYIDHGKRIAQGKQAISDGKAGCLLIAGGQGTRLRFNGPKGCFPVSVIQQKTLFQLFAEKTYWAGKEAGRPLPLAIMTSPLNHNETLQYFKNHQFFGLDSSQVYFFSQGMLPLLNSEKNLFLTKPDQIAEGPDGNGSSLRHFFESGIWDQWYSSGVRIVNTVLVDNPLADPFDAELIGFHRDENADVLIKCTTRADAEEHVGLIVKHNDRIEVVEYSEIPENLRTARDESGKLLYNLANLSLFSFSMDFIKNAAHSDLPLHLAHKRVPAMEHPNPENPNAWKFEHFIFDCLVFATKIKTLVYPRSRCFAPLKNAHGKNSLETVQHALQKRDREIFASISGMDPPERAFELSQKFYYPSSELLEHWKNRPLPDQSYID